MPSIKRKPVRNLGDSSLTGPRASTLSRCVPILLMLPPLLLSIALLIFQNHVILGSWRLHILNNLSAVSAPKQVVASILGTLQASAVIAILFNFPTRTRLARPTESVKLDTLGLLSALSTPRMDWNLPKKNWLLLLMVIVLGHGPAALWASAITPLAIPHTVTGGSILIPSFPEASEDQWRQDLGQSGSFSLENCLIQRQSSSFITNCPIPYHQNALLNAAQEATSADGKTRSHSKLDAPTWTYQGRSFGVGSSIGFTSSISEFSGDWQLSEYSFEEVGYNASVYCNRISPLDDNLSLTYQFNQETLGIFRLTGTLPNMTKHPSEPVIAWCSPISQKKGKGEKHCRDQCDDPEGATMFAWFAASNDQGQNMVGIRATSWYADDFDHIQCSIDFIPTVFTVTANVTNSSITVTHLDRATMDPDPTRVLVDHTVLSLNYLSKMSSSLYVSVLGEAFSSNLNATLNSTQHTTRAEAALKATEASFEAILDDILGIYGSGQMLINDEARNTTVQGTFKSYRIGTPLVHYLTLLLNLIIVVVIAVAAIRTTFWHHLPRYDILDFKSSVTAASFGGKDISRIIQRQHEGKGKMWSADPGDRKLGEIEVRLLQTESEEPRIIPHNDGLLTRNEVDGDGIEMDEGFAQFESDLSYKSAATAWSPVEEHDA